MYNKISKLPYKKMRHIVSSPFIAGMAVPIVALDLCTEIYHHVCFPLYGIPLVKRSNYIKIDHQKLSYLKGTDKLNCMYCGYANGFLAYAVKVAGETERYWCGIKHAEGHGFVPQPHQKDFLPYGDKEAFEEFVTK